MSLLVGFVIFLWEISIYYNDKNDLFCSLLLALLLIHHRIHAYM